MDIMELGAIGEFVSGLAVIGSLIYVGLQVRQSNRLEKAESVRSLQRDYVHTMLQADARILRESFIDFEGMSKEDQTRAHTWLIAFYSIAQTEISLCKQNLADEGDYPSVLASFLRSPGLSYWWSLIGQTFGKEFRDYVDENHEAHRAEPAVYELMPWMAADESAEGM